VTHYHGNIEHQVEVFRSPENYGERYGHRPEINLPTSPNSISWHEGAEGGPVQPLTFGYLTLIQHRHSMHIPQELLDQYCPDLNFRGSNIREHSQAVFEAHQAWVIALIRRAAEATYTKLKEECWDGKHNIIIDSVKIIWQLESDRILIDLNIYACRHQEVELAQRHFHQALMQLLQNSMTVSGTLTNINIVNRALSAEDLERARRQLQQWGNINWYGTNFTGAIGKKYDDKAEERATKLLKSILSKKENEIYKKEGYVIIKGTKNRTYKVKKNSMIEVSEKRKNKLYKTYRICIDPKRHGTISPTDEVVAKIRLIQADEEKLYKVGSKFKINDYGTNVLGYGRYSIDR